MNKHSKGIIFALTTALISGISVFINGFASKTFSDPYLFTTLKNIVVALLLSSIIIGFISVKQIKKLRWQDWLILIAIGLIGGSIPFLLFFKGLTMSNSSIAAFTHKTLFIWATIFAFWFLKEKISWHHLIGFVALLFGLGLMSPWKSLGFGIGEFLILIATLLWAIEAVIIRKVSNNSDFLFPWGRMFFGSIFMLVYIVSIGRIEKIGQLSEQNWWWLILTSIFLLGYVMSWYSALKHAPIVMVTSILAIGFPITVLLQSIFITHQFSISATVGLIVSVLAAWLIIKNSKRLAPSSLKDTATLD